MNAQTPLAHNGREGLFALTQFSKQPGLRISCRQFSSLKLNLRPECHIDKQAIYYELKGNSSPYLQPHFAKASS